MLPNAGIHFPSQRSDQATYQLRYVFGYAMDGANCRATFSGLYGRKIVPFGVLMHGRRLGSTGQMWLHSVRPCYQSMTISA